MSDERPSFREQFLTPQSPEEFSAAVLRSYTDYLDRLAWEWRTENAERLRARFIAAGSVMDQCLARCEAAGVPEAAMLLLQERLQIVTLRAQVQRLGEDPEA